MESKVYIVSVSASVSYLSDGCFLSLPKVQLASTVIASSKFDAVAKYILHFLYTNLREVFPVLVGLDTSDIFVNELSVRSVIRY